MWIKTLNVGYWKIMDTYGVEGWIFLYIMETHGLYGRILFLCILDTYGLYGRYGSYCILRIHTGYKYAYYCILWVHMG